jgi:hypothetical protein
MVDAPAPTGLGDALRIRLDDPKTRLALGVALFGLGIVLGFKLGGGQSIDLEDCGCDEVSLDDVAKASAVMVDHSGEVDVVPVQPTKLPDPIDYLESDA